MANTNMANMLEPTVPEDMRDIFPFFDLPRELRDMIYEYSTGESVALPEDRPRSIDDIDNLREPKVSIETPPLVQLLCTNRQVKQEYEEIVKGKATLVISDNEEYQLHVPSLLDNFRLGNVQQVELRVVARCNFLDNNTCGCPTDLNAIIRLVDKIIAYRRLSHIKTITFSLGIFETQGRPAKKWPESPHSEEVLQQLESLVATEKIARVRVFWRDGDDEDILWKPIEIKDLWVTWTKKDGWKAPDEDEEGTASQEMP